MVFIKFLIIISLLFILLTVQEHWETPGNSHYEFVNASSNLTFSMSGFP